MGALGARFEDRGEQTFLGREEPAGAAGALFSAENKMRFAGGLNSPGLVDAWFWIFPFSPRAFINHHISLDEATGPLFKHVGAFRDTKTLPSR